MKHPLRSRYHHAGPQDGRSPQPLESQRHERGTDRQTGHCHCQFIYPVCSGSYAFASHWPGGQRRFLMRRDILLPNSIPLPLTTVLPWGMTACLYSLPSRDLIADSIEYMANAHKVDALFCISNCDKITPGMLMAAMRLNIPAIFVSGGPMEAGVVDGEAYDLVDAMVMAADENVTDEKLSLVETAGLSDLWILFRNVYGQFHELSE